MRSLLSDDVVFDSGDVAADSPIETVGVALLEVGVHTFAERQGQLVIFCESLVLLALMVELHSRVSGGHPGSLHFSCHLRIAHLEDFSGESSCALYTLLFNWSGVWHARLRVLSLLELEGFSSSVQVVSWSEGVVVSRVPTLMSLNFAPHLESFVHGLHSTAVC